MMILVATALAVMILAPSAIAQSNANPATLANVPGVYECRTGSVAAVAVGKEATVTKFDATTPLLRIEIGRTTTGAQVVVRPWDVNNKVWLPASTSDSLVVTRSATFSDGWGVMFEGVVGGNPASAVSLKGFLGQGTGAGLIAGAPADKPILNFSTLSDFRGASAGSALCEKVG
jgi:hypothetical protein